MDGHGKPVGHLGVAIDLGWLSGGTCCVVLFDYLVCRCFRLRVISGLLEASEGHVLLT